MWNGPHGVPAIFISFLFFPYAFFSMFLGIPLEGRGLITALANFFIVAAVKVKLATILF